MTVLATALLLSSTGATGATAAPVTPSMRLGAAQPYSELVPSVTNADSTSLSGNLGVTSGISVTGFGPGSGSTVGGSSHAGDAQAASDLATAYQDATGHTPPLPRNAHG